MGDLTGRYAVVTGAGKGIGAAIAERMLRDNVKGVALLDYDGDLVQNTAQRLDPTGERVKAFACDVSDCGQVEQTIKAVT